MQIEAKILSDITVFMKYAKFNPELNRRENWKELVDRNKQMHLEKFPNLKDEIENAYQYVYDKKILPSMRSLQFAGKPIAINNARLYNCCFLPVDHVDAFSEVMFLLLSGTGVGYSVQRYHVENLPEINKPTKSRRYLVGDSIEGWADAVRMLCKAYFTGAPLPLFDFRDIRPKGAQLITVGGKAPGPEPLKECLFNLQKVFDRKKNGEKLTSLEAHDMACHIADAVLSGGIRRAALISLFNWETLESNSFFVLLNSAIINLLISLWSNISPSCFMLIVLFFNAGTLSLNSIWYIGVLIKLDINLSVKCCLVKK